MATGYDDIDNLTKQTNQLYDQQMKQQQNIINTSTQQTIDEIERNKQKIDEEATKTNRGLYTDYQKQVNPYGVNAENLAEQGLAGSGLAESTKANYYNTYQTARTEATNNANSIKADFDAQITKARQNGDLQLAQAALQMFQQKIQDLYSTYNLKFQQDQFAYQKEQDALAQNNWQQQFDYQKTQDALSQSNWEKQFNYTKNRDSIADNQWQQQFDYSKTRDEVSDNQWQQQFNYNKDINDRNYNYQLNRDEVADKQWEKQFNYNKDIDDRNYNYQLSRDDVSDKQWEKQFNYNKDINDRTYNYQLNRDKVSDNQWQKEYELSKKKSSSSGSSSRSSRSSSSSSSSSNTLNVNNNTSNNSNNSNVSNGYEVRLLTNNTIAIKNPNGQYSTLTIPPDATDEQIASWGERNGVPNILDYLK